MPLSNELQTKYVKLINRALNAIPMEKQTDFRTAAVDLEQIIASTSTGGMPDFDPQFKSNMKTIYKLYTRPENFVQSPKNYAKYRKLIKDEIQKKINEFNSFSELPQFF